MWFIHLNLFCSQRVAAYIYLYERRRRMYNAFTKFDEFFAGQSGNPVAINYMRTRVMLSNALAFRSGDSITFYRLRPPHSPRFDAR